MIWMLLLTLVIHSQSGELPFALDGGLQSTADDVVRLTLAQDYGRALDQAKLLYKQHPESGSFFWTMVRLSRFDDLGDTLGLFDAKRMLDTLSFKTPEWEALRLFQLGYIEALTGHSVSAALKTRSAAKVFQNLSGPDALAFHAIYAFYMEAMVSWIPGVKDQRPAMLAHLERSAVKSHWFWALFGTAAVWMRYDRQEYAQGLATVDAMLKRAPNHPVFLQMRADMLFKMGKAPEAAAIYEQSANLYAKRAPKSIRYWSAVGNLVRIYHHLGMQANKAQWNSLFNDAQFQKIRPWMPQSLMKDLKSLND